MLLIDLPTEILHRIIAKAVDEAVIPSNILGVCQLFHDLGTECLYTHLRFTAPSQLQLFSKSYAPKDPIVVPRSVTVDLAGAQESHIFQYLHDTLRICQALSEEGGRSDDAGRAQLERLCLRMNSYTSDTTMDLLSEGLLAISVEAFEWTGPDPDHHFSTAIVASVASSLFDSFVYWHYLREIKVTNITFTTNSDQEGPPPPLLHLDSLRTLYIGQATFLHPQAVAGMFLENRSRHLEEFRLVDAYSESIWGPRLRRSDVEKAARSLCDAHEVEAVIADIRMTLTCEKKTERIMGGDRVEGTNILD
ncbi:hypothetical protein HYDPIDRAFT_32759 [Hydnomerulius pinastri MD-312]|uniref:F-box domain-containing protein n=1 Tax=Hydnomerulius pinastri MD-312 TaxID=994086 RepID=A0A0C9V3H6_9AGAM|nr:hypothetical protein HYDPIDRAFT_32759 [Hydnomerulius pinastri MD-312]